MNSPAPNDPFAGGVLIVSPEPWDSLRVSKHHYATTLAARGSSVFFLNPPDDSLDGIHLQPASGSPGICVVSGPRVAPGLRRIGVVWLFENSRFFDMRFAGSRLKIYHQVDLNQDFHPETAAATADICLCTTDAIAQRLRKVRPDVHKIHHGTAIAEGAPVTVDLGPFDRGGIHATCAGNLESEYLDFTALAGLVRAYPHVIFHFVGSCREDSPLRRECAGAGNVVWWGKLPSTQIPALTSRSDVLLVAYRSDAFRDQLASPHKFMEYLLSGKAVVCSYTDEYKDKRHLVTMADPAQPLAETFEHALTDLDNLNAPHRMAERRAFAMEHRYENQLARIERIVRASMGRSLVITV
jgi:Glycosyl transferases group 1